MGKKGILAILLVLAVFVAGGLYRSWPDNGGNERAEAEAPSGQMEAGGPPQGLPVEAAPVRSVSLERTIEAVGSLESSQSVIIRPEIAGRIAEIAFEEGQAVAEGDVLIRLEDSVYRAEVNEAQAALNLAESNFKRARELFERGTGTARARDEALAAVETGRARLELTKARLDKTVLTAPFSGVVGLRRVDIGDYVTPGQDIVNLEDLDPLKADFRLPEVHLPLIESGQAIRILVDAFPGQVFEGEVTAIDPRVDEQGRSFTVRALVPNNDRIMRPGMFARIRLVTERSGKTLVLPEQALMPEGTAQFVYRVTPEGTAERIQVQTGRYREGQVEITGGLREGDTVIVAGQMKIQPGMPVTVLPFEDASMQGETVVPSPALDEEPASDAGELPAPDTLEPAEE